MNVDDSWLVANETLIKTISELVTALALLVGGGFALWKWLHEVREQRLLRERESQLHERDLRWRQADAARKLLDDLDGAQLAQAAVRMLDWDDAEYNAGGKTFRISERDYVAAMRTSPLQFSDKEEFIRNAFDELFAHMATCEHHVQSGLVLVDDIRFPYDYYLPTINRNRAVFDRFLAFYHLTLAQAFLQRLDRLLGSAGDARRSWRELESSNPKITGDPAAL